MGKFEPGHKRVGGRAPGTPNKITRTVKETILAAFNELQGDPAVNIIAFAKKYPRDFYAIAAKLIPTEVIGTLDVDTTLTIRREIVMRQENLNGNGQLPVHAATG